MTGTGLPYLQTNIPNYLVVNSTSVRHGLMRVEYDDYMGDLTKSFIMLRAIMAAMLRPLANSQLHKTHVWKVHCTVVGYS